MLTLHLKHYRCYFSYALKMDNWLSKLDIDLLECLTKNKKLESVEQKDVNTEKCKELTDWFASVPRCSTFRVNPSNTSVENVIRNIEEQLKQQASARGIESTPPVAQDDLLQDCVVVGCWNEEDLDLARRPLEVIVDTACGIAILRGAHLFAPGVMSMSPETKEGDRVSVYADLTGRCLKGRLKPYDDAESKLFVGNGVARMTRRELFEGSTEVKRVGKAVEMTDVSSGISSFKCQPMWGLLQNYPSILCSHILNPEPGDAVLDMCASPGNKTTHIASLMKDMGVLIALDKTAKKVQRIAENCNLQAFRCFSSYVCNSINAIGDSGGGANERLDPLTGAPPYPPDTFDKILLDAPCSALGQRPQLAALLSANQINSYPSVQRRLFKTAVGLLKPGGVLVYSTCTIVVQENEGVVKWALETFPDVELACADPIVGAPGCADCGLTERQRLCVQKFGPARSDGVPPGGERHRFDTIGFFIAKFRKKRKEKRDV